MVTSEVLRSPTHCSAETEFPRVERIFQFTADDLRLDELRKKPQGEKHEIPLPNDSFFASLAFTKINPHDTASHARFYCPGEPVVVEYTLENDGVIRSNPATLPVIVELHGYNLNEDQARRLQTELIVGDNRIPARDRDLFAKNRGRDSNHCELAVYKYAKEEAGPIYPLFPQSDALALLKVSVVSIGANGPSK